MVGRFSTGDVGLADRSSPRQTSVTTVDDGETLPANPQHCNRPTTDERKTRFTMLVHLPRDVRVG